MVTDFNDDFELKGVGFAPTDFHLDIYNRWGEIIYQSNNYNNHWDGRVKGNLVQNDVYVWTVEILDYTGHKRHFNGRVTVFR